MLNALFSINFELLTFIKEIPVVDALVTVQFWIIKYLLEFCICIQYSKLLSTSIDTFSIKYGLIIVPLPPPNHTWPSAHVQLLNSRSLISIGDVNSQ